MEGLGGRVSGDAAGVRRHGAVGEFDDRVLRWAGRPSVPVSRRCARYSREQRSQYKHHSDCDGTCTHSMRRRSFASSGWRAQWRSPETGCASAPKALRQIEWRISFFRSVITTDTWRSKQGAEADDQKENLLSFARIIVDEHASDLHRDPGSAVILRRPQVHDLAVDCEDHVCERV